MDSSASSYFLNHSDQLCLTKDDTNLIDLGLSLKTLQPQAYYPSSHENYDVLLDWQQLDPQQKMPNTFQIQDVKQDCSEELPVEGMQSKRRWSYVKVNMDGAMVGRKLCILDHVDYMSLARRLEDMFGKQCLYGLRLFEDESHFSLFYMDRDEQWRPVGDVPWKEFVDRVKRLRIARRGGTNRNFR